MNLAGPARSLVVAVALGLAGLMQAGALAWPGPALPWLGLTPGEPSGGWQMASLLMLVLALRRSDHAKQAAVRAWWFATVWLVGTFWWLFVSMHVYGGLPSPLAALAVLALAGALALYYAAAAAVWRRWRPASSPGQVLLFVALWTLAELARGQWLTGFPWGAGGYAQVDLMAAWAPWVGVYGMGAVAACLAAGLALLPGRRRSAWSLAAPRPSTGWALAWAGWLVLALGVWLPRGWDAVSGHTEPAGSLRVWLLQGNIAQDEKFEPGAGIADALAWYPGQVREALAQARDRAPGLVVAPETAIPLLPSQLPPEFWRPWLSSWTEPTASPVGALIGLPLGRFDQGYSNAVWGIEPGSAARALADLDRGQAEPAGFYRYDKHHLVPFGEFIPPLFRWFTELMHIPLGDFERGGLPQPSWHWAGQRLAPNICYEDLFGEELAASFADSNRAPTVLVNLSNIAWFGDTVAIDQHLQISRLRALEMGRPMLRATNTGATAVIDHRGKVTHRLPRLTRGRLEAEVQGREGLTPYARWVSRWGLVPLWVLSLGVAWVAAWAGRRTIGQEGAWGGP